MSCDISLFKMDSQPEPAVQHRGRCSVSRGRLDGRDNGHVYVGLSPFAVHLKLSEHRSSALRADTVASVVSDSLRPHGL